MIVRPSAATKPPSFYSERFVMSFAEVVREAKRQETPNQNRAGLKFD
jgi:hypothetical protein